MLSITMNLWIFCKYTQKHQQQTIQPAWFALWQASWALMQARLRGSHYNLLICYYFPCVHFYLYLVINIFCVPICIFICMIECQHFYLKLALSVSLSQLSWFLHVAQNTDIQLYYRFVMQCFKWICVGYKT